MPRCVVRFQDSLRRQPTRSGGLTRIKDAVAFYAAVKALPEAVKTELRAFETALSKRLGPNVSAGDRAALASVPEQQRKGFEAALETLKTVARVTNTDRQQRIAVERLVQSQRFRDDRHAKTRVEPARTADA